jgi:hypothetical protein
MATAHATLPTDSAPDDPLGTRRTRINGTLAESVFEIRPELSSVGPFEFALRERVATLAAFHHPAFVQVRRVERTPGRRGALAVVSDPFEGTPLSDVLATVAESSVPLPTGWALKFTRDVVDALAALHATAPDVVHGILSTRRILIGPASEALISGYVLGAAIEQLRYSRQQYWTDLEIPTSFDATGFDRRLDLFQIGVVALQLLGGRSIPPQAHTRDQLQSTLDYLYAGDSTPVSADTRRWLTRMLRLDAPFASAAQAREELDLLIARHAAALGHVAAPEWLHAAPSAAAVEDTPAETSPATDASTSATEVDLHADTVLNNSIAYVPSPAVLPEHAPSAIDEICNVDATELVDVEPVADAQDDTTPILAAIASDEPETPSFGAPESYHSTFDHRSTFDDPAETVQASALPLPIETASSALPEIAETVASTLPPVAVVAETKPTPPPIAAPATPVQKAAAAAVAPRRVRPYRSVVIGAVVLAVAVAAAVALGGGRLVGVNRARQPQPLASRPIGVILPPADTKPSTAPPAPAAESRDAAARVDASSTTTASAAAGASTGTLQIRTQPAGAQVSVDGTNAGRSPLTVTTSAGEHTIVVTADATSVKDTVVVQRGATTSVIIPLGVPTPAAAVAGWVRITAPVDVQVFEDNRLIGTSDTDRLMLPTGTHQLDIVNAASGYRTHRTVSVMPGKVTALAIDVPNGVLAVNAQPWAEVWLDGEKIGPTPIGNLAASVGKHELVFRHPTLGEQRRTVVVPVSGIARTSVDMTNR